jgi:hypothetical protein
VAQDLELRVRAIRYRRERWLTPDGRTVLTPPGVKGHFGTGTASLRADAIPPGSGHGAATGGTTTGNRRQHTTTISAHKMMEQAEMTAEHYLIDAIFSFSLASVLKYR